MHEKPFVVEACIGYLCRILNTGIEEKMPKTKIIISSKEAIMNMTSPVILDPSYGFGEERPNVLSEDFFTTFKYWALLTGCICLSPSGEIIAVGRDVTGFERPMNTPKWGMASTSKFDCIIIEIVNEDHIVVYKNGSITMEVRRNAKKAQNVRRPAE